MTLNELNVNEIKVMDACKANVDYYGEYNYFCFDEIVVDGLSAAQVRGYMGDLCEKGIIGKCEPGYYFDMEFYGL